MVVLFGVVIVCLVMVSVVYDVIMVIISEIVISYGLYVFISIC